MIPIESITIAVDEKNKQPLLLLKPLDDDRVVPIPIGPYEASALVAALNGTERRRPSTHDVLASAIDGLDGEVFEARIVNLQENVFYAEIILGFEDDAISLEARPSDAITLAILTDAATFIDERIVEKVGVSATAFDIKDTGARAPEHPTPRKHGTGWLRWPLDAEGRALGSNAQGDTPPLQRMLRFGGADAAHKAYKPKDPAAEAERTGIDYEFAKRLLHNADPEDFDF